VESLEVFPYSVPSLSHSPSIPSLLQRQQNRRPHSSHPKPPSRPTARHCRTLKHRRGRSRTQVHYRSVPICSSASRSRRRTSCRIRCRIGRRCRRSSTKGRHERGGGGNDRHRHRDRRVGIIIRRAVGIEIGLDVFTVEVLSAMHTNTTRDSK